MCEINCSGNTVAFIQQLRREEVQVAPLPAGEGGNHTQEQTAD